MKYGSLNVRFAGFYLHVLVFFAVNFGLFLLNVIMYPFTLWFYFPLLMWATALLIHFFAIFIKHEEEWNEHTLVETIRNSGY